MKTYLLSLAILLGFSAQVQAVEVGEVAQCVVLDHIQSDNSLTTHCIRDHKPEQTHTILEFFSISCSACKENLPHVNRLAASLENLATTRLVSIDRNIDAVKAYVIQNKLDLPFEVALDSDRDAKNAYGVFATPTLFVLDSQNTVIFKHIGVLEETDIEQIEKLVRGN